MGKFLSMICGSTVLVMSMEEYIDNPGGFEEGARGGSNAGKCKI